MFLGILGTFNFLVKGEGRKFLDAWLEGANEIGPSIFLDSLGAK